MKYLSLLAVAAPLLLLTACKTHEQAITYNELYAPEELGLNLRQITDGSTQLISASGAEDFNETANYATWMRGFNKKNKILWSAAESLAISPDKQKIAYVVWNNKQTNIMVIDVDAPTQITQRTFRDIVDVAWGVDNQLYFSDYTQNSANICSVDAEQGSLMNQHTTGSNYDYHSQLSEDGVTLYFTRWNKQSGPSIWSVNTETGKLSMCARGFHPCPDPRNHNAFYCVRNSSLRSEIWYVDYVKGKETLVATDENRGFTHPSLSPDGKWLACTGNAYSNYSKKQNRDIFAIKTDGSKILQLTFHPYSDVNPVWGKDGKSIFFLSKRNSGGKTYKWNVWQMNVDLPQ